MQFGPTDYRIYYACIEYDNHTVPGFGSIIPRLCLARSSDGISWHKPSLGVTPFPSNIMAFCYEVSVFEDLNPQTLPAGRYKMLCNKDIYEGPDGIRWTKTGNGNVTHADDTQDTGWWNPDVGKYVIYVRRDLDIPAGNTTTRTRFIGRCETSSLNDWEQGNRDGCPPVFGPATPPPTNHFVFR